jgi:hypothetical protein
MNKPDPSGWKQEVRIISADHSEVVEYELAKKLNKIDEIGGFLTDLKYQVSGSKLGRSRLFSVLITFKTPIYEPPKKAKDGKKNDDQK